MRILVVDDDPLNLQFLSDLLMSRGYEVQVARDGEEAWFLQCQANAPRLLIVDWVLPKLSGPELCRRIRARADASPVYIILLTGHNPSERIHEGLAAGADDFLAKPYHPKVLLSHIAVGVRQLSAASDHSGRILKTLQDASQLGSCDVVVRGQEASGRICIQNGGVIWAELSNDPESLFDRLLQESRGALVSVLPMLDRYPATHRDDSGERIAMEFAEFAEFRSTLRAWIRRKVAQIVKLTLIDVRIAPVSGRHDLPGNLELPLSEVIPDTSIGQAPSQSSQARRLFAPSSRSSPNPEPLWEQTFPAATGETTDGMRAFLEQTAAIRGFRGAALLQLHRNACLLRVGVIASTSPLLAALHVLKELYHPGQGIGSVTDAAPELIITSGAEHQVLQVIPGQPPLAALLILDSATCTLAMARHQLQRFSLTLLRCMTPGAQPGDSSQSLLPVPILPEVTVK